MMTHMIFILLLAICAAVQGFQSMRYSSLATRGLSLSLSQTQSMRHSSLAPRAGSLFSLSASNAKSATSIEQKDNIILYDGVCNFCNAWVDLILTIDFQKKFRFAALQSKTGQELLSAIGKEKDDISSVLLVKYKHKNLGYKGVEDGSLIGYEKSDAVIEVLKELGIAPLSVTATAIAAIMPRPAKDGLYDAVARNRYKFLGKRSTFARLSDGQAKDADRFLND